MRVSGKPRPGWRRRTSGRDADASTTAPSEDFACEPCPPPFEQQPQYKAPRKGASTFLESRVVQLRGALSTGALSSRRSSSPEPCKACTSSVGLRNSGGSDGTRTRGLLRDRQAF